MATAAITKPTSHVLFFSTKDITAMFMRTDCASSHANLATGSLSTDPATLRINGSASRLIKADVQKVLSDQTWTDEHSKTGNATA